MLFLEAINFTLPLQNPVLQFSLILFIILFAPILLNKFKIPHLIGLIIAGAIVGPHGFNLMLRDSSIELFGTTGLLYIMFLAGLEIDMAEFKKNAGKSIVFGLYTFSVPMILGFAAGYYVLQFTLQTSILLASMFASHTLIVYPMLSKMGVAKNRAVTVTVGGTMITDTLALLVLAVIAGTARGEITNEFWIRLGVSIVVFILFVMFMFPLIGRWFFKHFDDAIGQYIFVLGMVFLAGFLAEAAGIEPIIGAFLAGLSMNRLIPRTSPLMNRIDFVGNALFIPFFLIGVGMLIDYRAFFQGFEILFVAAIMTVVATFAKFAAAWLTQKTFRYSVDERRLIFGLSNAQAAATLATVLVGYNIILNQPQIDAAAAMGQVVEPVRLFSESVLNGSILMILITCTIASIVAQKGARHIALNESVNDTREEEENDERILIPVNSMEQADNLMELCTVIKSKNNKRGLYALNVVNNEQADGGAEKEAKKILSKIAVTASATDNYVHELLRYDSNVVSAITSTVLENRITDVVLGLHEKKGISGSFLGNLTEGLLTRINTTTLIYKPTQPIGTLKRHLVIVPDKAEKEIGFLFWLVKTWNIARNTGAKLVFYASPETLAVIQRIQKSNPVEAEFKEFSDWDDFLIVFRDVKPDDNMIIVLSRRNYASYHTNMTKIPGYLNKYFQNNTFILVYPIQNEMMGDNNLSNPSLLNPLKGTFGDIERTVSKLFKKK